MICHDGYQGRRHGDLNRYMAHLKSFGGWVDIEELYDRRTVYGAFGYFMTWYQRTEGEPWIKLLNENTAGEIGSKAAAAL